MIQTKDNSRNQSVDTFRLLAALCVIILHAQYANVPRDLVANARLMSRWAIPFFFIMSGYYFAERSSKTKRLDAAPIIDRLIWIFLLWAALYAPFSFIADGLNASGFFKLITASNFIFFGNFYHLWFVSSLLFGYLFVAFCYRYNATILLPVASVASLVIALISGAYDIFEIGFKLGFNIPRHWLSIPFLYIGFLLFQKGRPNWRVSALLVVFGASLQFVEAAFLHDQFGFSAYKHQFLIGTILFSVGMASLALDGVKFLQHPLLGKWGAEYSLGIYLIHPAINYCLNLLIAKFIPALSVSATWQALFPLTLLILSIMILSAIRQYLPSGFNFLLGKQTYAKEIE